MLKNDRAQRVLLVRRLAEIGVMGFALHVRGRIALFFVAKKDGCIRLICDAREPNWLWKRPPHTPMSSAAAWSRLDLSTGALETCSIDPAAADRTMRGNSGYYPDVRMRHV